MENLENDVKRVFEELKIAEIPIFSNSMAWSKKKIPHSCVNM